MMRHHRRHRHHHHRHHHHGPGGRWRTDPAALRLWRVMARMRVRVFVTLAAAVGGGVLAGWRLAQPGAPGGWILLGLAVALWVLTGALAFKLTRRFLRVVDAARAIGDGALAIRVEHMPRWGEFAVLGDAINDMAARLQRQITDQKQLLAAVSHELRTPLGHLRILIDSGRERGADAAMCDELEREVLRLDALVARLLTSSRLDFATLERRVVDVGQLVREALRAAGVGDEVRVRIDDPCVAAVDPTLVRSAVGNLIDNAQRHGGGLVEVRVTVDDDALVIEFDDAGPGVPPERQGEVFAPFVPSAGGGLGLGMALVGKIAAAHDGRAWLRDRPGGGARAGLRVPVRDAAD